MNRKQWNNYGSYGRAVQYLGEYNDIQSKILPLLGVAAIAYFLLKE